MLLDIIIPTYEYPEGLRRILSTIPKNNKIRVIISDDSKTNSIINMLKEFDDLNIVFISGPKDGPIRNWNCALNESTANYVMFLHHDEEVIGLDKLLVLLKEKEISGDVRPIVLSSTIQNSKGKWRTHSVCLLNFCLSKLRWQLPFHNFIGATACLIVHKKSIKKFKKELNWLVDCEWYYRVLRNSDVVVSNNDIFVKSYHYPQSITWSEESNVRNLYWSEVRILSKKPFIVILTVFLTKLFLRIMYPSNWRYS